jgi:hypothetical protein
MQDPLGKSCVPSSLLFVLDTQPLAKPPTGGLFHRSVGLADRTQAEVVGPTMNLPVERFYQRCRILLGLTPSGHLADRLTNTLHSLLGRSRAPVGPPRLRGVASTKRVPKKIELLFRQSTDPVLLSFTVNFSLDIMFRIATRASISTSSTADHQVISIINDVRFKTLLVPQFLPPQHQPTHV